MNASKTLFPAVCYLYLSQPVSRSRNNVQSFFDLHHCLAFTSTPDPCNTASFCGHSVSFQVIALEKCSHFPNQPYPFLRFSALPIPQSTQSSSNTVGGPPACFMMPKPVTLLCSARTKIRLTMWSS